MYLIVQIRSTISRIYVQLCKKVYGINLFYSIVKVYLHIRHSNQIPHMSSVFQKANMGDGDGPSNVCLLSFIGGVGSEGLVTQTVTHPLFRVGVGGGGHLWLQGHLGDSGSSLKSFRSYTLQRIGTVPSRLMHRYNVVNVLEETLTVESGWPKSKFLRGNFLNLSKVIEK
jgi:hypothetical protein